MLIFLFAKLVRWFFRLTKLTMELLHVDLFLFVQFFTYHSFSPWNLHFDFSPYETDFVHGTCCVLIFVLGICRLLIFVRKTCCILIFLFVKFVDWFFSTWNWFYPWNLLRSEFSPESCCKLYFLFVKLVRWFFFLVKQIFFSQNLLHAAFCSWILLHVHFSVRETCTLIFVLGAAGMCWFCSCNLLRTDYCLWKFLHVDFSLPQTWTLIFLLVKLILFMELVVCWNFFVNLVECWFLYSWNLSTDFFSSWNLFCSWNLLRAEFCSWNLFWFFFCVVCCILIFIFVILVHWFFSWNLLNADFCSWNM